MDDIQVVKKLLQSTSAKFLQITSTIEEFSDLKKNRLMRLLDHSRHMKKGCKGLEKKMKSFSSLVPNGRDERM